MINSNLTRIWLTALVSAVLSAEIYSDKYDNIDLDKVLTNQRLYNAYIQCMLNQGKCTPDAVELKKVLPEAIETECAKCTQKQKKGTAKVLKFLITLRPDDFEKLEEIYDPTGIYRARYNSEVKMVREGKPVTVGDVTYS